MSLTSQDRDHYPDPDPDPDPLTSQDYGLVPRCYRVRISSSIIVTEYGHRFRGISSAQSSHHHTWELIRRYGIRSSTEYYYRMLRSTYCTLGAHWGHQRSQPPIKLFITKSTLFGTGAGDYRLAFRIIRSIIRSITSSRVPHDSVSSSLLFGAIFGAIALGAVGDH